MPRTIELDDAPDPIAAEELPKDFWSAQLQIGDDHYHARRVAPGYYTINDDQGRFVVGSTPSRPVLIYCDGGNDWIIDASGLLTWDEVSARLRAMCEAESLPEEIELQDLTLDYAGVFSGEFLAEWGTVQPMRGGYRFFPEDDVDLEAIAAHRIYRAIRVLHAYGPWAAFLAHTPAPELEVLRLQCCELPELDRIVAGHRRLERLEIVSAIGPLAPIRSDSLRVLAVFGEVTPRPSSEVREWLARCSLPALTDLLIDEWHWPMADDRPLPVPDSAPGATLRLTVLGETDSPLDAEAEEPEKIGA